MIMMEKLKYLESSIFHCYFVHHAFHMDCTTVESVSPWSGGGC